MTQITVGELKRLLAELGPEMDQALVETQGCDCEGPCSGIEVQGDLSTPPGRLPAVLLLRGQGE